MFDFHQNLSVNKLRLLKHSKKFFFFSGKYETYNNFMLLMKNLIYLYCSVSLLNNAQRIDNSPLKKLSEKKGWCYNKIFSLTHYCQKRWRANKSFAWKAIAGTVGVSSGTAQENAKSDSLMCYKGILVNSSLELIYAGLYL